jgi:hypothetical protein
MISSCEEFEGRRSGDGGAGTAERGRRSGDGGAGTAERGAGEGAGEGERAAVSSTGPQQAGHRSSGHPFRALSSGQVRDVVKTSAQLLDAGITRNVLTGHRFRSVLHGVHVPASVPPSLELRCDALQLVVPQAVFSHRTAAALYGLPLFRAPDRLDVTVGPPKNPPRHAGVHGYERRLAPADITIWRDRQLTTPARTFVDLAGEVPLRELVMAGDTLLKRGLATSDELAVAIERLAGRRGVGAARRALSKLEPASGSPGESLLRLRFEDEGLPRPECNVAIYDEVGGLIAIVDFLLRAPKIIVEYEGACHLEADQFRRDTLRDRLLVGRGYALLRAKSR